MISILKHFGTALVLIAIWGLIVFAALDQGWGHSAISAEDDTPGFVQSARDLATDSNSGNISFVLIEGGERAAEFHLSKGETTDGQTVFQVASLGKWLTAWGVMDLVEQGEVAVLRNNQLLVYILFTNAYKALLLPDCCVCFCFFCCFC